MVEEVTGNKVFKKNAKHTLYIIDIEKPMYKKYISYGLTCGVGMGLKPYSGTSFDTVLYSIAQDDYRMRFRLLWTEKKGVTVFFSKNDICRLANRRRPVK